MAIVDRKVAALGPVRDIFATRRLCHIQDDRHPVFVVVPLDALVSVCRIRSYQSVRLRCVLCWLKVFEWISDWLRLIEINLNHFRGGTTFSCLLASNFIGLTDRVALSF